jgi:hypothetical protein
MILNKHRSNRSELKPYSSLSGEKREENVNVDIVKTSMSNIPSTENSEFKNKRVPMDGIELLLNREKIPNALGKKLDKKNIKETTNNSPQHKKEHKQVRSSRYSRNDNHIKDDPLTDLDDIISDAESLKDEKRFKTNSPSRKNDRLKRRFIKRRNNDQQSDDQQSDDQQSDDQQSDESIDVQHKPKTNDANFFPSSKFGSNKPKVPFPKNYQDDGDDVSEIVSDGQEDERGEEGEDNGVVEEESISGCEDGSDVSSNVSGESGESEYSQSSKSENGETSGNSMPNFSSKWKPPSSMSKEEINSEKMDLLYRYSRLEGNGYKSGLNLSMNTKLETLRIEVTKLDRMRNVQRSIRTQRKLLISFASGTEYVNKRYNPYKFALDGWSGDVLENIGDYDEVFEELHDKYKDSVQMSPEIRLLSMCGGSALMFHLSNTLFKSSTPELNDILKTNPDIMAQIQKAALGSMANANAGNPMFDFMNQGIQERQAQQANQAPWDGRKGYAPPRTSQGFPNPQPSNMHSSVNAEVNQVPQGQGIFPQKNMRGPEGFDDILNQLNASNMGTSGLISDVEEDEPENTKEVNTKQRKPRQPRQPNKKKNNEVIDLDM